MLVLSHVFNTYMIKTGSLDVASKQKHIAQCYTFSDALIPDLFRPSCALSGEFWKLSLLKCVLVVCRVMISAFGSQSKKWQDEQLKTILTSTFYYHCCVKQFSEAYEHFLELSIDICLLVSVRRMRWQKTHCQHLWCWQCCDVWFFVKCTPSHVPRPLLCQVRLCRLADFRPMQAVA